ncbi:MAG: ATP-binding protein [Ruminococcus sp.]|nr:ATP-binding protein [Ruminococcus sp.]
MNIVDYNRMIRQSFRGKKMKTVIKSFYIDGYRNLSNVTLYLNDITAIIALNNYGKSNLINAIRLGIDFIKGNNEIKNDIYEYQPAFPFLRANSGQDFKFGVNAEMIDSDDNTYSVEYSYSLKWRTKVSEGLVNEELLKISSKSISGGKFIDKTSDTNNYVFRASLKSRNKRKIIIKDNSLAINALVNIIDDDDTYLEILTELNNISFLIEDHFDANDSYAFDPINYRGNKQINVPRMIWEMKENHPTQYSMLIDGFKQLFPNIEEVTCQEHTISHNIKNLSDIDSDILFNDNIYTLSVTDPSLIRPINFNYLSDGTKRVFLTLTTAVNANINKLSVLALEEPENSIHPKLLQSYISILDFLSGDCKIVFTSHSPYIIQFIEPSNIVLGLPSETGQADFRYINKPKKLIDDAYNSGCSVGDYIFSSLSFENATEMLDCYLTNSQIVSDDKSEE